MRKSTIDLSILLAVSLGVAVLTGLLVGGSAPGAPARLTLLDDVVAGRSIAYTPYPVGYFEFAGQIIRGGGFRGLIIAQGAQYLLTVFLSYRILLGLGARGAAPLFGGLAVALYPNLFMSITRFQDTAISCFLLAVFGWVLIRLRQSGLSLPNAAIAGALFGFMLLVRPNAVTLAPIAAWAAFHGRRFSGRQFALLVGATGLAIGILAAVILPAKGRLVVFDSYYAAYAFCNGTHQHALEGTLRDYNGEMTMPQTFQELGLPSKGLERTDSALAKEYIAVAWRFIREHPFRYLLLEGVKTLNLFRPDYRNTGRSFLSSVLGKVLHTAIAGLFFFWVALRVRCRHLFRAGDGLLLIPSLILYFAPFIASNTDPRYRVPVDLLLIIESVYCLSILLSRDDTILTRPPLEQRITGAFTGNTAIASRSY
jgi:hypothetical protein